MARSDAARDISPIRRSLLTDEDLYLFNEGSHVRLYRHLGAHPETRGETAGTNFAVWAPNAESVSVIGDFNGWDDTISPLEPRGSSGIWESFLPGVGEGAIYKYAVKSREAMFRSERMDPFGFYHETPPKSGSIVWDLDYRWTDDEWMKTRGAHQSHDTPMSVYEVHAGSWKHKDGRPLTYLELAEELPAYLGRMNFTHVEFLPITEHPFYGSWGYQVSGYFAPTSRFGTPQDFMVLVDGLHQAGIGVILDWVPSHFPIDGHALGFFDGTHLYEHQDQREGFHPDWGSYIFNYGRHEVRSFLLSSALFWLDRYHIDGLRVDAVASMLYRDYSRKEGEWIPNIYGGNENLEAISFLRRFNEDVYKHYPDVQTLAEESTSYPQVSRPTYLGGLGFGYKWDMGWMHDMLEYMTKDPVHRRYHHNNLTFRMLYAHHENFLLPLSHDEVTHGKGALLSKMPGDYWQKFANLRLLYGYMYAQPGKKLLFMGADIGQWREWAHDEGLEWHLLDYPSHSGLQRYLADLNGVYRDEPALHEMDADLSGFEWVDCNDVDASTISFLRRTRDGGRIVMAAYNFTPVPREQRIGVPRGGRWREILNSDASEYGGSGIGNAGGVDATGDSHHGRPDSIVVTLPPLAAVLFVSEG